MASADEEEIESLIRHAGGEKDEQHRKKGSTTSTRRGFQLVLFFLAFLVSIALEFVDRPRKELLSDTTPSNDTKVPTSALAGHTPAVALSSTVDPGTAPTSTPPPDPTTTTPTSKPPADPTTIAPTRVPPPDWMKAHLQEKVNTDIELQDLEKNFSSSFIKLDDIDVILSYRELEEQFLPLLQGGGLIMVGDSTTRVLFVTLWCLMDGLFRYGENDDERSCNKLQEELKQKCKDSNYGKECDSRATFTNATMSIHLQNLNNYDLESTPKATLDAIRASPNRTIYFGLPCLHSLWSPGTRENAVHTDYAHWPDFFRKFYDSVEQAVTLQPLLFGTTVTLCDAKLGSEKELIDAYLRGEEFVYGTTTRLSDAYTHGAVNLPPKYSGPIPLFRAFRKNHSSDNALFDETGGSKCTSVGLQVLAQHNLSKRSTTRLLDIHGVTANGCDNTPDGRHYTTGLTVRRELMLLLKAMESGSNGR